MDFSGFTLPPAAFYPQSSAHSATTWPGTFQRPTRVLKPTIRNVSPHGTAQRRYKPLPGAPSRTRSVIDRRPTFAHNQNVYDQLRNRPTSWHNPSCCVPTTMPDADNVNLDSFPRPKAQFTSTEVNGLFTPMSMPRVDEPNILGLNTPLNEMPAFDLDSYDPILLSGEPYNRDHLSFHQYPKQLSTQNLMMGVVRPDYYDMYNQFQNTTIHTAPPSPNFLPIQSNAHTSQPYSISRGAENLQDDELVGMGLYDSPADVQSLVWEASPVCRYRGSIGKGLKLEDSFQLPDEDSDVEAEDPRDGPHEEGSTHISVLHDDQHNSDFANGSLQEQSFFFGDDDNDFQSQSDSALQPYSLSGWAPAHAEGGYGWI